MYLFKSFKVQAIGSIVDCNFMYYLTFSFGSRLGVVLECVICISIRKEFAVIRGDNIICCGHWQVLRFSCHIGWPSYYDFENEY